MSLINQSVNGLGLLLEDIQGKVPEYISHYRINLELMSLTGCRANESLNRNLWQIMSNGDVRLRPLKKNNSRYFDIIELPIDFENWLHKNAHYELSPTYRQLQNFVQSQWLKYDIHVGESRKLLHLFRHYYVKRLIQVGHSLEDVQVLMGHTHYENTVNYATSVIKANVNFEEIFNK